MGRSREPNSKLAAVMEQAGMSAKGLARRIEHLGAAAGEPIRCNHTDVQRWLTGMRPQDPKPVLIARALSVKLGHHVTIHEIGFGNNSAPDTNLGLIYSPSLSDAVLTIGELATFDSSNYPATLTGPFSEEAANAATLDWLFGHAIWDLSNTSIAVSGKDVAEIDATSQMIDSMDRSSVGPLSQDLAIRYLREKVVPRLHGSYTESVGKDLFRSTAILCELIGYMAYDSGNQLHAERYFIQALRMSKEAGDHAYGAFVLNTMSHQAMYRNDPRQALRFARAAGQTHNGADVPIVATEAAMLEALASASMGDKVGCRNAIALAEAAFQRQPLSTSPAWAAHWSETVFASFAGDSWLTIGDTTEARPYLLKAWEGSRGQSRREVFAAGQLAKLAILDGSLDEAAHFALLATETADGLNSRRSTQVVRNLHTQLVEHQHHAGVQDFLSRSTLLLKK